MITLEKFAEKIKDFKSAYCAGGIQNRTRQNWRNDLGEFFVKNDKILINPVSDNAEIFNPSVMGYKEEAVPYTMEELLKVDEQKRIMLFKQTEENDIHFMNTVDLQIFNLDKSAGFGTWTEFRENFDNIKKPFIIVRNISRQDMPHWIEWRRYQSIMLDRTAIEFKNFVELKEFFIKYLGFKK